MVVSNVFIHSTIFEIIYIILFLLSDFHALLVAVLKCAGASANCEMIQWPIGQYHRHGISVGLVF